MGEALQRHHGNPVCSIRGRRHGVLQPPDEKPLVLVNRVFLELKLGCEKEKSNFDRITCHAVQ
jgi:hypothetical protein